MRVVLVAALLAACGGSHHGPTQLVEVYAFTGDTQPAEGVTVIAHTAAGAPIDSTTADASGHAEMQSEDGALITVVFPAMPMTITPSLWLVTAPAPAAGGELDIHGPIDLDSTPPTVAGPLDVAPKHQLQNAATFQIQLGCTITQVATLPTSVDVSSRCLGSDSNLDALVLGYDASSPPQVVGYTAARLDLSTGAATLAPDQWTTATGSVPITLDASITPTPLLDWVLWADGLPFGAQPISGTAPVWTGLAVDAATVHATLATPSTSRITTLEIAGAPTAVSFAASDFLPPIDLTLALDTSSGDHFTWASATTGADAIDLHLEWDVGLRGPVVPPGSHHVVWDVVLPPDATDATLAQLGGDLGALVGPPDATPDAILRYVTAPTPMGFDALVGNGLYVEAQTGVSTIAPRPTSGELRETRATGYAP